MAAIKQGVDSDLKSAEYVSPYHVFQKGTIKQKSISVYPDFTNNM